MKFKVGDRVKDKGLGFKCTVIETCLSEGRSVLRLKLDHKNVILFRDERDVIKLKPKKPLRECWVEYLDETIVQVHYEPFNCHCFLEHGHEVVHMREVIK